MYLELQDQEIDILLFYLEEPTAKGNESSVSLMRHSCRSSLDLSSLSLHPFYLAREINKHPLDLTLQYCAILVATFLQFCIFLWTTWPSCS